MTETRKKQRTNYDVLHRLGVIEFQAPTQQPDNPVEMQPVPDDLNSNEEHFTNETNNGDQSNDATVNEDVPQPPVSFEPSNTEGQDDNHTQEFLQHMDTYAHHLGALHQDQENVEPFMEDAAEAESGNVDSNSSVDPLAYIMQYGLSNQSHIQGTDGNDAKGGTLNNQLAANLNPAAAVSVDDPNATQYNLSPNFADDTPSGYEYSQTESALRHSDERSIGTHTEESVQGAKMDDKNTSADIESTEQHADELHQPVMLPNVAEAKDNEACIDASKSQPSNADALATSSDANVPTQQVLHHTAAGPSYTQEVREDLSAYFAAEAARKEEVFRWSTYPSPQLTQQQTAQEDQLTKQC